MKSPPPSVCHTTLFTVLPWIGSCSFIYGKLWKPDTHWWKRLYNRRGNSVFKYRMFIYEASQSAFREGLCFCRFTVVDPPQFLQRVTSGIPTQEHTEHPHPPRSEAAAGHWPRMNLTATKCLSKNTNAFGIRLEAHSDGRVVVGAGPSR